MEKERKKLDKQLDHALEKAKAANHGQEVLETKIKVCAMLIIKNIQCRITKYNSQVRMLAVHFDVYIISQIQEQETETEIDKEAASRVSSLAPSASFYVKNRDRPSYMPMRSASMRETSYSRSIRRR